jgi:hypothetical protein
MSHLEFCDKSPRQQGFEKMQTNQKTLSLSHVVPANCSPALVRCCLLGSSALHLRHQAGHMAIRDEQLQGKLLKYRGLVGPSHLHYSATCHQEKKS